MRNIQTEFPHISIKLNEPLSQYTYTKTGGKADIFVMPKTIKETQEIVSYCHRKNIPLTILGNGSNLIIKDGGIRGVILHLDLLQSIERTNTQITAMSGAKLIETAKFALEESLSGLEFACGIPGSIGGALHMNAGAYGGEISDVLEAATVLTQSGELKKLKRAELKAAYRFSTIAENNYIVLDATFSLQLDDKNNIQTKMAELTAAREAKQPLEYPSCGSVFKRPAGHFAGKLIQDSGLQGHIIGGAQVSLKHAGFIVNIGGATATDYMNLITFVQKTVREKFDIELETEVKIIGEDKEAKNN
ncbi:UDP-N-acetylmuramate dehydrogenase [Listeria ivanovii]|uniref:UDP-N-acetylenolpyruvoylglucosamine reductase n=1 Tax=Listeria ivanovii (strain ATCC BAA-678 / PAM 55) TaxID=881621 RepID=G2Z8G3_LISIP|nr:UDP-N-acetylmuramate dehydrogenase [Listeria ivanovii]AHI55921.1 UDP-N-acetylenolpyruvoylglucosamine reductase [Listeria ivanovii WSLC3009]AIS65363.1 UDP-N-acetylenolpyruvoylglucosamine reductase [Listeria ivanovii subsp. ivanovii]MBC1759269.1 UDP-N-acetylmuramate dehydrogenase [Listeria ivanovii]MBK3914480.1 UDP-N-acetylmuramate dehydrogenase [Listeria ivanovii subsp. ivanovii]MBK3921622.1 UDP-N-acetylmuramate dehydrogenase [Listeria ivanovii subsp. ivanovii]